MVMERYRGKVAADVLDSKRPLHDGQKVESQDLSVAVGAVVGTTQAITVTAKDGAGDAIARVTELEAYFCTDAAGAAPSATGAGTGVTATTGAILKAITAKLHFALVTDANGVVVLSVNNAGGGGVYTDRLAIVIPGLGLVVSAALAVPAA